MTSGPKCDGSDTACPGRRGVDGHNYREYDIFGEEGHLQTAAAKESGHDAADLSRHFFLRLRRYRGVLFRGGGNGSWSTGAELNGVQRENISIFEGVLITSLGCLLREWEDSGKTGGECDMHRCLSLSV